MQKIGIETQRIFDKWDKMSVEEKNTMQLISSDKKFPFYKIFINTL